MSGNKSLVLDVWPLKCVMSFRGLFHYGNSMIHAPPDWQKLSYSRSIGVIWDGFKIGKDMFKISS